MRRISALATSIALLVPTAFAAVLPVPESTIIRSGSNLEWKQSPDTEYPFAGEQKRFQEWMTMEYNAWKNTWAEPLNPLLFAAENRRVRKMLTAAHRRAVRTNDWDNLPRLMEGTDRASNVRTGERVTNRPSRRLIVKEAERLNVVRLSGR